LIVLAVASLLTAGSALTAEPLHQRIDALVAARAGGRPVSPPAGDAEFLRRVSLDLAGTIPTAAEARDFLQDRSPDKRARRIDQLLAGPAYPRPMQEAFHVMLMERLGDHHTLQGGPPDEGFIHHLAWHQDGFVMAVTSGQPGHGKLFFQRLGDAQPFWTSTGVANCHALAVHPGGKRLVVAATNGNSNGNGRRLGKNKEYPGNWSPLFVWDFPAT
jgi:hypothetical protein